MIPLDRDNHLGTKTLIIFILQGTLPGVALLVLVIFLSIFKSSITSGILSNIETVSQILPIFGNNLRNLVPVFIPLIFFLAIIVGGVGIIINTLRYKFFLFTLEEFSLKLRKGVLRITEISIPYRQMQNVDITRPLLYRFFGLSRLVILSAGHEQDNEGDQTDTVFDPIDFEIAEGIRGFLGRRIGVQVTESEQEADKKEAEKGKVENL